jgi:hypothetical protein
MKLLVLQVLLALLILVVALVVRTLFEEEEVLESRHCCLQTIVLEHVDAPESTSLNVEPYHSRRLLHRKGRFLRCYCAARTVVLPHIRQRS